MKNTHKFAARLLAGVLCVWLILMGVAIRASILPNSRDGIMLVVFEPGTPEARAFSTIVQAGGNPVRSTWLNFIWTAQSDEPGFVGRLKQHGAVAALEEFPFSPQLAGCFAFSQNLRSPLALKRIAP